MFNQQQRKHLLRIARESIEAVLAGRSPDTPAPDDEDLMHPSGAFVTLTCDGILRGCIGTIEPSAPLWKAVSANALAAAFRDPRFSPLRPEELPALRIEISVMSPIAPVQSVDDIRVGRDGLIIRSRGRAGLLLPQVATEHGWSRDAFLSQTCLKAGLPADEWRRSGCLIEAFSAEVFGEEPRESIC